MDDFDNENCMDDDKTIRQQVSTFWEANSESDSDSESSLNHVVTNIELAAIHKKRNHRLSFNKLKRRLYKQCDVNIVHKYSTVLDAFMRYIQCHHVLYSEASYYCCYKLNVFMLPCMFLSTTCSVITTFKINFMSMTTLLAVINGVITFLLAIVNYLKLDAHAEAHKISAYQYSKLRSHIKIHSGELLLYENEPILVDRGYIQDMLTLWDSHEGSLIQDERDKMKQRILYHASLVEQQKAKEKEFIDKVKNIMSSIKETLKNVEDNNNFSLPRHILCKYSVICNTNIFLYIKSIDNYKNILLNELCNVKNEIRFYTKQGQENNNELRDKYKTLYQRKNELLRNFLEMNKGYTLIDKMLQQELVNVELKTKYWLLFRLQTFFRYTCININVLPDEYKKSIQIGYRDKEGKYLLEKVLEN
tara:strand:- start:1279 stop:2532 length:1254 start_codon:yes stop_codon:yes gene_type:complete